VSGFQPRRRLSGGAVVTRRDSCVGADKRLYKIVRAFARCFAVFSQRVESGWRCPERVQVDTHHALGTRAPRKVRSDINVGSHQLTNKSV